jgi:hypothetical protein
LGGRGRVSPTLANCGWRVEVGGGALNKGRMCSAPASGDVAVGGDPEGGRCAEVVGVVVTGVVVTGLRGPGPPPAPASPAWGSLAEGLAGPEGRERGGGTNDPGAS